MGAQGAQGTQGSSGSSGNQGAQGLQGTQGTSGLFSGQGAQGTQGTNGLFAGQGAQGTQGAQGVQGFSGGGGAQGAQGTQGRQGAQGVQGGGAQGVQGTSGGGEGGSGTFDTNLTESRTPLITSGSGNDIFTGPTGGYTFPVTSGRRYIIESIHVTNIFTNDLYLVSRHDFSGGSNIPLANRVIVPYQGSLELLEQPMVAQPSDIIRLQAMDGTTSSATGINNGLQCHISISQKIDTSYFGIGALVSNTTSEQVIYTVPVGNKAVIQSIRLCNYNLNIDIDASVILYDDSDTKISYLAYKLTIPKNSTIELCQRAKYLGPSGTIRAFASYSTGFSILVYGRTSTA